MKVYAAALALAVTSAAAASNPQRARKGARQSAPVRRLQGDKDAPVEEMSMSLSMSVQSMAAESQPEEIACPLIFAPVCCDGVTYDNDCVAGAAGASDCAEGACETAESLPEAVACPLIFAPVCCDLVTYDNDCEAEAAGASDCTEGPCPPLACPLNIKPVCGCDGVTYDNDCLAEAAGTTVCSDGECEVTPCPKNYEPVCGCDMVTYDNECLAEAAGTTVCNANGECKPCNKMYAPVCGRDGVTYDNSCMAENAGQLITFDAACPEDAAVMPALGSSYCTWSPDLTCYPESGWPACCGDDEVECPDERPACDGEEKSPNLFDADTMAYDMSMSMPDESMSLEYTDDDVPEGDDVEGGGAPESDDVPPEEGAGAIIGSSIAIMTIAATMMFI